MLNKHPIDIADIAAEDSQLIENQLRIMLESKYFKSAKQMQRFLKYIVEKTLIGEGQFLKQYTIGVEAFSYPDDFNPDENPSVRIMGGRVRKRLDEYYEDQSNIGQLIISLRKGGYIPDFYKSEDVTYIKNEQSKNTCCPTLALVSITDKSQSKKTNSLLLQLTDTIATEFSRFMSLQLVVCNPFSDKEHSHLIELEMKSTNRAEYVLALFLQNNDSSEDKYRLIYRLILVDTGEILWSENYLISGQPIKDQDYLIGKIVARVGDQRQGIIHNHWTGTLLADEDEIPVPSQVLAYYRNYINNLDRKTFAKGVEICLEAIERNPNDENAHIIYAEYCMREYVFDYEVIENPLGKGMLSAETAVRLAPNLHEAHLVYALLLFCIDEEELSLEEFEVARGISENNMVTEFGFGFQLCKMNQWEKGLRIVNKSMLLSTSYPSYYHLVPFLDAYRQEKYEKALYEAKKITTLGLIYGPLARCVSYVQLEKFDEAEKELEEVIKRYSNFMVKGQLQLNRYFGAGKLSNKIWADVLKVG